MMRPMSAPEDSALYLRPTYFVDCDSEAVTRFTAEAAGDGTDVEKARRVFLAVRDAIRYDPYVADFEPRSFKASTTLERRVGYCVPKAILLTACYRALGLPTRLGFADVTNHLATRRLLELLGTAVFAYHGFAEVWLGGRWLKATPTFNATLCEKFGVDPLVFDGEHDAVFLPFDRAGNKHMEYLRDRGRHADFNLDEMHRVWKEFYPKLFELGFYPDRPPGGFEAEAAAEPKTP